MESWRSSTAKDHEQIRTSVYLKTQGSPSSAHTPGTIGILGTGSVSIPFRPFFPKQPFSFKFPIPPIFPTDS